MSTTTKTNRIMQPVNTRLLVVCSFLISGAMCLPPRRRTECDRSVDVAIIGAGAAGSYFAYRLRDAGLNIELFEYSNRIGGRLFTVNLPRIADVNLELGGMRFVDGEHVRVQNLVRELNLTTIEFIEGTENKQKKYYLRGRILTSDDVSNGDVPYDLSPEEKAHQDNIAQYYLEQLTGFNGTLTEELAFKLKTKDGRELYKLSVDEALGMVATPEGRQFLIDSTPLSDSAFCSDVSNVDYFMDILFGPASDAMVLTLKEGMSAIPVTLVHEFLKSSNRNKLTLNRKLEAITRKYDRNYILNLQKTTTVDGLTREKGPAEFVCAKKVVLAIPQFALTQLKWTPLSSRKVKNALSAVVPAKASKVFLAFPKSWWLNDQDNSTYTVTTDARFRQLYDWKPSNVSGDYVLLASYSEGNLTEYQQSLNSEGELALGSAVGLNRVTNHLKQELLRNLGQAYGINANLFPETTAAISQFWTSYPFGGAWTLWRAGYNFTDVLHTIQRPSTIDDVYIVGSDISFIGKIGWTEGALRTVDLVYNKYFI